MGKKGGWFSAIKRVFVHNSKDKQINEFDSKNPKETKKKVRGLRYGETKSFIPMFREPSSIEKILGEVDEQNIFSRPPTPFELPKTPQLMTPRAASPKKATSTRVTSPRADSIRVASPRAYSQRVPSPSASFSRDVNRHKDIIRYRVEPTLQYRHLSATKIQTAYRGYMARRSFRALRGLVRLQGVVRGQNVKRQTANTLKMMQQLVRVQTQIRSRRIQTLLDKQKTRQSQAYNFDKELESTLGKWDNISQSEAGNQENWDYSTLTKEEREDRMHKKMEAAVKRERTMAYAYSRQPWKSNTKSSQASLPDVLPGGYPYWNWLERHKQPESQIHTPQIIHPIRTYNITPTRRTPHKTPRHNAILFDHNNYETTTTTPTSTRSMAPPLRNNPFMPTPTRKTLLKKDDNCSLASFSSDSVPNYMTPTASAKARANSNPKERAPPNDAKRRFSFPLTPIIGSFKWNNKKESSSTNKDLGTKKVLEKDESFRSGGDFSIDSAISMPAAVGRKPFNRFV